MGSHTSAEISSPRIGEELTLSSRSDRFFLQNGQWFFHTREGFDIGPFVDKVEAQLTLSYFIENLQWPNEKQLRTLVRQSSVSNLHNMASKYFPQESRGKNPPEY